MRLLGRQDRPEAAALEPVALVVRGRSEFVVYSVNDELRVQVGFAGETHSYFVRVFVGAGVGECVWVRGDEEVMHELASVDALVAASRQYLGVDLGLDRQGAILRALEAVQVRMDGLRVGSV